MKLNHYSCLFHLPPILKQGLWRGEIATHDLLHRGEEAVSLTTQFDPDRLNCWGTHLPDKTAVRYICDIPDDDVRLEPTRDAWRRLEVPKRCRDLLDPCGQSKWWFFYRGTIKPSAFVVQLRGRDGYHTFPDLSRLTEVVNVERDKYEQIVPPGMPWALDLIPKDPEAPPSWVLDEVYPADRFRDLRAVK